MKNILSLFIGLIIIMSVFMSFSSMAAPVGPVTPIKPATPFNIDIWGPSIVNVSESFVLNFFIMNPNNNSIAYNYTLYANGSLLDSQSCSAIGSGTNVTYTFNYTPISVGTLNFSLQVVTSTSEYSYAYWVVNVNGSVDAPLIVDMTGPSSVALNEPIYFNVEIFNPNSNLQYYNYTVYVNGISIDNQSCNLLGNGTYGRAFQYYDTAIPGFMNISIQVVTYAWKYSFDSIGVQVGSTQPESYVSIWINQRNYGPIGFSAWMDIGARNDGNGSISCSAFVFMLTMNGGIIVKNETICNGSTFWLNPGSNWQNGVNYYFTTAGYYQVQYVLYETVRHEVWCWWEIGGEYSELWIQQKSAAHVGEPCKLGFSIQSFYNRQITGHAVVFAVGYDDNGTFINNRTLLDLLPSKVIIPSRSSWYTEITTNFSYIGHYEIVFQFSCDDGRIYKSYCRWEIGINHLDAWIDNTKDYYVNIPANLVLHITNHYNIGQQINMELIIIHNYNNGAPGTQKSVYNNSIYLNSFNHWSFDFSYIFTETGHHDYEFRVWSTSDSKNWYDNGCFGEVKTGSTTGGIVAKITASDQVAVNSSFVVVIEIQNKYSYSIMVNYTITSKINGNSNISITSTTSISAYSSFKWQYTETPKILGTIEFSISALCTTTGVSASTTKTIQVLEHVDSSTEEEMFSPGFDIFVLVGAVAIVSLSKRKFDD